MLDYESIPLPQGPTAPRALVWYLWLLPLISWAVSVAVLRCNQPDSPMTYPLVPLLAAPNAAVMALAYWAARCQPWSQFNTYFAAITMTGITTAGPLLILHDHIFFPPDPIAAVYFLVPVAQSVILAPATSTVWAFTAIHRRFLDRHRKT